MAKWNIKELFWRTEEIEEPEVPGAAAPVSAPISIPGSANASLPPAPVVEPRRAPLDEMLLALRDVQGVVGSLAVGLDGTLWGRDLPRVFDEEATQRLASRVVQLHDALTSEGGSVDSGTLRYQGYQFHLGVAAGGLIGVLTEENVNMPALRMALRLVARRLSSTLAMSHTG
jgi:predicted regulator of Ras-like GTPase activity (Roadblock/LC7/MglB family)